MRLTWSLATAADADAIAALRNTVAQDLTTRHGRGAWSGRCTARGVRLDLRHGRFLLGRFGDRTVATALLTPKKPWAINRAHFTAVARPLYVTALAVAPDFQRRGIGRCCLARARRFAHQWPADSLCLDAYDHPDAGAGDFYRACGFRAVGRATYRGAPLIYFQRLL